MQEGVQKSLPREVEVRQRHGRMTTGKNPSKEGSRVWSSLDQPTSFANFNLAIVRLNKRQKRLELPWGSGNALRCINKVSGINFRCLKAPVQGIRWLAESKHPGEEENAKSCAKK